MGSQSFTFTGAEETWVVPTGVTSVVFDVIGAGESQNLGGRVTGTLAVTPGETLRIRCGGQRSGLTGGFNGGGNAGAQTTGGSDTAPCGGHGATDIRQGGAALANRVVVAGGAGGDGGELGAGTVGGGGAGGGTTGAAGANGSTSSTAAGGGTPSAGGAAGTGPNNDNGTAGSSGQGGNGGSAGDGFNGAGGGGGGYFGGGGGGADGSGSSRGAGGGGGGSSFTHATQVTGTSHTQGYASANTNGSVLLTYSVVQNGQANIPGSSTVTATGRLIASGVASISGLATVTATAVRTALGQVSITGQATVTATGTAISGPSSALIQGQATVTATGRATIHADIIIQGAATVTATGTKETPAQALIQGTSLVTATGRLISLASALIQGTSYVRALATLLHLSDILTGISGPVVYTFRYERRTKTNQFLQGVTDAIYGCAIDANNDRAIFRLAQFKIDSGARDDHGELIIINPLSDHLAVFMDLLIAGVRSDSIQMGLFALNIPRKIMMPNMPELWEISAADNSIHLIEATTTTPWTVAAGQNYLTGTNAVRDILDALGLLYALPATALTLPVDRSWPPGTTWSTIVTDLLNGANMYQLAFNRQGVGITQTRIDLASRTPDATYTGDDFVLSPLIEESETTRLANQVVAVINDPNRAPLSSVATNADPDSPISTVNLGRTITKVISADLAADQTTLDAIARNYLQQEAGLYRRATLTTSIDPRRDPNEVYELTIEDTYDEEKWWCRNWRVDLTIGAQMNHTLGKVERIAL